MRGRYNDGIRFLTATLDDWQPANYLACHNMWHWAVFHIEKGEHDIAKDIFMRQSWFGLHFINLVGIWAHKTQSVSSVCIPASFFLGQRLRKLCGRIKDQGIKQGKHTGWPI